MICGQLQPASTVDATTASAASRDSEPEAGAPSGTPQPDGTAGAGRVEGKSAGVQESAGSATTSVKTPAFNGYDDQWREELRQKVEEEPLPSPSTSAAPTEPTESRAGVQSQDGLRQRNRRKITGEDFENQREDQELKPSETEKLDKKLKLVGCAALFFALMACGTGAYILVQIS